MTFRTLFLGIATAMLAAGAALAADVEVRLQSSALSFKGGSGFTNAHLRVTGPNDFEAEETASRGLPVFRVRGGRMKDGFYHFVLSAATDEKIKITRKVDNGRGEGSRDHTLKPFHMDGMFEVRKGRIVPAQEMAAGADGDPEEAEESN